MRSVLLQVRRMSNNANSNVTLSDIAWYYGVNDSIIRTSDFIARSDAVHDLQYLIWVLV